MCWGMNMVVRITIGTEGTKTNLMIESSSVVWDGRQRAGDLADPWRVYEIFDFHRMRVLHKEHNGQKGQR